MLFALSTLLMSTGFAAMVGKVPDSEASLGGITLGNTMSYVRSVYGGTDGTAASQDGIE